MFNRLRSRSSVPARLLAPVLVLALLAGCTSSQPPTVNVARFWTTPPPRGQTVAVTPAVPDSVTAMIQQSQAAAIAAELAAAGFPAAPADSADLIAVFTVSEQTSQVAPAAPPVSVGIGGGAAGGSGGGSFGGIGGSIAIPIGGNKPSFMLQSTLQLTLQRRVDGQPLWEGRAVATQTGPSPATDWRLLARAALSGYPGQGGQTVSWKPTS